MLHRSPTFMKPRFLSTTSDSRPEMRISVYSAGRCRGFLPAQYSVMNLSTASMCSGPVPQQPPSALTSPRSMKVLSDLAKDSGVSS